MEFAFNTYRNVLSSFGLGVKTGIDLENESIGIIGKTVSDDLLLNLIQKKLEKNYSISEIAEALEQPLDTIHLLVEKLRTLKTD